MIRIKLRFFWVSRKLADKKDRSHTWRNSFRKLSWLYRKIYHSSWHRTV